jgi:hypothetical protein
MPFRKSGMNWIEKDFHLLSEAFGTNATWKLQIMTPLECKLLLEFQIFSLALFSNTRSEYINVHNHIK